MEFMSICVPKELRGQFVHETLANLEAKLQAELGWPEGSFAVVQIKCSDNSSNTAVSLPADINQQEAYALLRDIGLQYTSDQQSEEKPLDIEDASDSKV